MVPSHRSWAIHDLHPRLRKPIGDLDVLPGRMREGGVEQPDLFEQPSGERDVRRVEEVEGHRVGVLDQGVAELEPVLVDVVKEGGGPARRWPRRVPEHRDGGVPPLRMAFAVDGEKLRFRHRVVAEEQNVGAPRFRDAAVAGAGGTGILLEEGAKRVGRLVGAQAFGGRVARAVVDDEDFELGRRFLPAEGVENAEENVRPAVRRDHYREGRHAAPPTKISPSVVRTRPGARSRNSRKKAESNLSSPGYVGTIRSGNRAKISESGRRRADWTARRLAARDSWLRRIQRSARRCAAVRGSSIRTETPWDSAIPSSRRATPGSSGGEP